MSRFAIVCEAHADFETATDLADRVFIESVDWLETDMLEHQRKWCGTDNGGTFLKWSAVRSMAKEHGLRVQGHFGECPAAPDAQAARRALRLLRLLCVPMHGVLLIRDDDGDARRRQGLEQARSEYSEKVPIVIGLARTKRECWVLAGFEPCDEGERERLESLRSELGFDPRDKAEDLTAKHDHDRRSAKRVLAELTQGDLDRERDCCRNTSLVTLGVRGTNTGLQAYLQEVQDRLTPVLRSENAY